MLSVIVMVAVEIAPRLAPLGLLKVIVKVSSPSLMLSSTIGMKIVLGSFSGSELQRADTGRVVTARGGDAGHAAAGRQA